VAERTAAEQTLARRTAQMEELTSRSGRARAALERLELRAEQARASGEQLAQRSLRLENELAAAADAAPAGEAEGAGRVAELERELAAIHAERERELDDELQTLRDEERTNVELEERLRGEFSDAQAARDGAADAAEQLRTDLAQAEREAAACRARAASVGAELAAVNEFLRARSRLAARAGRDSLADRLTIEAGLERALAAALGGRLDALLASDRTDAAVLLDAAGGEGGRALVLGAASHTEAGAPPAAQARAIADLVDGPPDALATARRLLAGVWLVRRIEELAPDFRGVAVTAEGRRWDAHSGELSQSPGGGSEQILARRAERERLVEAVEQAARLEAAARSTCESITAALARADEARVESDRALRDAAARLAEGREQLRRTRQTIDLRREQPGAGPLAVRCAQLEGELAAERRRAAALAAERAAQQARIERMRGRHARDLELAPRASALCAAIETACESARNLVAAAERDVAADRAAGAGAAAELARCAARESELQGTLRECAELVTASQVAAQRARDQLAETDAELAAVARRMGLAEVPPPGAPLGEQAGDELREQIERLQRRREKIGAVNPLAKEEYAQAVAHVEELESRREDLEAAMRELRSLIRETDRQIDQRFSETFEAAARNFQQIAGELFPGGSGRLRLVAPEEPLRPVLGGASAAPDADGEAAEEQAAEAEEEREPEHELPGVEIEIVPAGKSPRRLSLLSGGEKSMTALAFLFAVFLARPCPFYILDEVEAALDDVNLDRFIDLLAKHNDSAQFIVITHQKRTMEAADSLYGVSMGRDGVSKVVSRRLPREQPGLADAA
jgi:chromosome segregation protein